MIQLTLKELTPENESISSKLPGLKTFSKEQGEHGSTTWPVLKF